MIQYMEIVESLNLRLSDHVLLVSIPEQRMYHQYLEETVKTYVISTSRNPPSCLVDSLGTPWGLHEVCEIIGTDEPWGMVFIGRKPTGNLFSEYSSSERKKNMITTRILRLRGLEKGVNCGKGRDTYDRFVYLHGTNHENLLGKPSSSGCIQVSNDDAVELASLLPKGSHLFVVA